MNFCTGPVRHVVAAIAGAVLLAGCVVAPEPKDDPAIYADAVQRSAVFADDLVHPLVVIPADRETVEVVTWTGRETAAKYYPIGRTEVGIDVWVTVAPEVQNLCATYGDEPAALRSRLQQLLGLPLSDGERTFVLLQAKRSDIFRPCPDPDPSKSVCGSDFPENLNDDAHKAWFAEQVQSRYRAPSGYPWTRLGYTYDWNPETPRFGASEFVLRKSSAVTVVRKYSTLEYCSAGRR